MMKLIHWFFPAIVLLLATSSNAAVVRFDAHYFFQSEQTLVERAIKFDALARYSIKVQTQVWNALKKAKMPISRGYLVIAIRADGQVASWLDMQPTVHEYYAYEIAEAVKKVPPLPIAGGTVVFAMKMAIETAQHTNATMPAPAEWNAVRKTLANQNDIEALTNAAWPEQ